MPIVILSTEEPWNDCVHCRVVGRSEIPTLIDGKYRIANFTDIDHEFRITRPELLADGIREFSIERRKALRCNEELAKIGVEGRFERKW